MTTALHSATMASAKPSQPSPLSAPDWDAPMDGTTTMAAPAIMPAAAAGRGGAGSSGGRQAGGAPSQRQGLVTA